MKPRHMLLLAGIAALSSSVLAQSSPSLVPLPMETPSAALQSMPTGTLPGGQVLRLTVCLPYGDAAGMEAFVAAVSDPRSSMYRHFLGPAEIGARFGLPQAAVQKVVAYLKSNGMKIDLVSKNRLGIMVEGTASQVEAAFNGSIQSFLSGDPRLAQGPLYSFTVTPSVPAAIAPYIDYVSGLETFTRPVHRGNPLTPHQLETFYNVLPMYNAGTQGESRTVGITNCDGYRLSNLKISYKAWSLPTPSGGVEANVSVEVPPGDTSGGNASEGGEADLDIQAVLDIAPLCHLILYDSGGGGGTDYIGINTLEADDNSCDIITDSYGASASAAYYLADHNLHASMAGEGITYMNASGDDGTDLAKGLPWPEADPDLLAVGGTVTNTDSNGNLTSQTGWSGSGGGWWVSTDTWNKLPSWQTGKGVPTDINYRLIPDVALNASGDSPYQIYMKGGLYYFQGTSGASPTFAASLAVAEQQMILQGGLSGDQYGHIRLGLVAPLLYSFNGDSRIFKDITSGSNGKLPNGKTSNCTANWDMVTGWGVMNFDNFAGALSDNVKSITLSTSSVEGGKTTVTGTVTMNSKAQWVIGLNVHLSSSDSALASAPVSVFVPYGASKATFTIKPSAVESSKNVTFEATNGGWATSSATLTVTPPKLAGLSVSPTSVIGGTSSKGTVSLDTAAPSGGLKVELTSSGIVAIPPASVTVPGGDKSATFTIQTLPVGSNQKPKITATWNGGGESASVTVLAATVKSVSLDPTTIIGGSSSKGTVTLTGPAPLFGATITISSSSIAALPPTSVAIDGGAKSVTFTIPTLPVASNQNPKITATLNGSESATLTVEAATVKSVSLNPSTVTGGASSTGTVTLTGPAPLFGATITLAISADGYGSVPPSISIDGGATTATFTVTTKKPKAGINATVTATLGKAATAKLRINP